MKFEIDYKDIEQLEKKLTEISSKSEKLINDTLHGFGEETVKEEITKLTPISKTGKNHAKNSSPYIFDNFNLGFYVKPSPKFRYLVFPNWGLGTSAWTNRAPLEFVELGCQNSTNKVINKLSENLDNLIK